MVASEMSSGYINYLLTVGLYLYNRKNVPKSIHDVVSSSYFGVFLNKPNQVSKYVEGSYSNWKEP